jgi:branched-chain amino acid transport system permease protein
MWLLIIAAAILAAVPAFSDTYFVGLLARAFCFALLAITVDLLWGYAGILSLGQSAFFGIGAYSVGIIFTHFTGSWLGAALSLFCGIGVALIVAAALGWFIFYARISLIFPFYVSVVTLAVAVVFYQAVLSGGEFTGASQGLSGFKSINVGPTVWYWLLLIALAGFGILAYVVVRSDAGVVLVAIRENEERSRYLGYNTPKIKATLFAACAGLAAVSGGLYAMYTSIVAPSLVGFTLGTDAVIWTALGGRGTLIGPTVGAIVVNVVGPALNANFPFLWQLFLGAVFVAIVTLAPRGLLPLLWQPIQSFGKATGEGRSGTAILRKQSNGGNTDGQRAKSRDSHALRIENVTRRFGSLAVLRGITLTANRGELLSIVGPNGAGKTTLIRCIADGNERSSGEIAIEGTKIGATDPQGVVALGVGRKFQAANIFDSLTVADCLRLACWKGRVPSISKKSDELCLPGAALLVVEATGLGSHLDARAGLLSHGLRQALELAMVLALEPSVLLLDEPTAGLTKEERNKIAGVLTELQSSGEICIILIEHDFDFVKQISTRMVVLHQGEVALDGSVDEVANSEIVRSIYLGHAREEH